MTVAPFEKKIRRSSNATRPGAERLSLANSDRTDFGLAERLIRNHGRDLRYWPEQKVWLVWNGERWVEDPGNLLNGLAQETIRNMPREAEAIDDLEERKAHLRFIHKSHTARAVQSMLYLAQARGKSVSVDDLDANPMIFNVRNGTIELGTGVLRDFDRSDLCTKQAPVVFDPSARCPTWIAFLERIFGGDAELIGFMQRAIGLGLTGDTSEQSFMIFWGRGANGKSTLLSTITALLGDYARATPPDTFASRRASSPSGASPEIARLKGARLVVAQESEAGRGLNESVIKSITGGDRMTARHLHRDFFEFTPTFKAILVTNHAPELRNVDHGIQRRLRLVPFDVVIPKEDRDPQLAKKLEAELPGILNWAIEGCLAWQRDGLGSPAAVERATRDYFDDNDQLLEFLTARCEITPEGSSQGKAMQAAYRSWAEAEGVEALNEKRFGQLLAQRPGISKKKMRTGKVYFGIRLKDS